MSQPGRPTEQEYAPFYAGYVSLVPEGDVLAHLDAQREDLRRAVAAVTPAREDFRYGAGKWSVREVVGHLGDAERVFGYRALCFSRGDATPLAGFNEKTYVNASGFERTPLVALLQELLALRQANLALFRRLAPDGWDRVGVANGSPVSVRALAYIVAGHTRHHLEVLAARYGVGGAPPPTA